MKGGPSRQGRSERLLAFTYIGDLPLALDGAGISAIEASGEDEGALDLFDVFGVRCPLSPNQRRVARIGEGEGARVLLLGERVELGAVPSRDVLSTPDFLRGLTTASGLIGFVRFADTLFSLFDPARVSRPGFVSEKAPESLLPQSVSP